MIYHEYLIDPEGRGWCFEGCVGNDGRHWDGELPDDHWASPEVPT